MEGAATHRGQPIPTLPPAIKGSRVEGREVRDINSSLGQLNIVKQIYIQ